MCDIFLKWPTIIARNGFHEFAYGNGSNIFELRSEKKSGSGGNSGKSIHLPATPVLAWTKFAQAVL